MISTRKIARSLRLLPLKSRCGRPLGRLLASHLDCTRPSDYGVPAGHSSQLFARKRSRLKSSSLMAVPVCSRADHRIRLGSDCVIESIPDLTPLLKPTTLGDFATYFFASVGGLLLGGELGRYCLSSTSSRNADHVLRCRPRWWSGYRKQQHLQRH